MADLRKARASKAAPKQGALGKLRDKKTVNGGGEPKKALAALRGRRPKKALAGLGKRRAAASKLDFNVDGIRYHNVRVLGRIHDIPWGSVDISNGDVTFTAHNRYGSWMVGDPASTGVMKEPAGLGWGDQITLCTNLIARFDAQLKTLGIKTAAQIRAERDEELSKERKKFDAAESRKAVRAARKAEKAAEKAA